MRTEWKIDNQAGGAIATAHSHSMHFCSNTSTPPTTGNVIGGNDICYKVTAVPEPGTCVGAALALGAAVFTQRRRLLPKGKTENRG